MNAEQIYDKHSLPDLIHTYSQKRSVLAAINEALMPSTEMLTALSDADRDVDYCQQQLAAAEQRVKELEMQLQIAAKDANAETK